MEIIISTNSQKPIYEQITSQIKEKVMRGELKHGDAIPSMRALAKSLHISVITVQRAYEELQRDGFIETVVGKGSFISASNKDFWQEGLVALLDITEKGIDIDFVPVKAMDDGIRLANEDEKAQIMGDLWARSESMRDGTWINGWREYVATVEANYKKHAGFTVDNTSDEFQMFAHYLDCEAHTDIWRELFKTWNHTNELD